MSKILYSDGGCPGNGSPRAIGSWAWVEIIEQPFGPAGDTELLVLRKDSGYLLPDPEKPNTSIRMELIAIIKGLEAFDKPEEIDLYSDSAYCVNGIKDRWYIKWFATGKNSNGVTPANMDLWRKLVELLKYHKVRPHHVKGHSGNTFNEFVDSMATDEIKKAEKLIGG